MKRVSTSFRLSAATVAKLRAESLRTGVPMTRLIERAVTKFLK